MADFDVQPIAVSSPPQPAYVTSYRPAVSVRNNGVHEAYASGLFRIYTAGKLIFTTSILSGLIQPKQTKEALGLEYWTPPAAGTYLVLAYVTTDHDQVVSNDNLAPVTLVVAGTPPPPPPGVTAHAAQHEENAADEIDLDGLKGRLADAQTPAAHKASHMAGGSDLINVDGLAGTLLDGQPIKDHHSEHEDGGGDELNVEELSGVLKNLQKPKIHANEAHDPNYASDSDLTSHKTAATAHENRRNVAGGFCGLGTDALVPSGNLAPEPQQQLTHFLKIDKTWTQAQEIAAKGQANGYAGLGANALVPIGQLAPIPGPGPVRYLRDDQSWGDATAQAHKTTHQDGGADEISIAGLSGKATDAQDPTGHHVSHEPGGTDEIAGLGAAPHKTTHQDGGTDEISIAGLSGKAADAQSPTIHDTTAHYNATAILPSAPGFTGYPGTGTTIPRDDHVHHSPGIYGSDLSRVQYDPDGNEHLIFVNNIPSIAVTPGRVVRLATRGWFSLFLGFTQSWVIRLRAGPQPLWSDNPSVLDLIFTVLSGVTNSALPFTFEAWLTGRSATSFLAEARLIFDGFLQTAVPKNQVRFSGASANPQPFAVAPATTLYLSISAIATGQPAVVGYSETSTIERLQ